MTVSIVGYKFGKDKDVISETFSHLIQIDEKVLMEIEKGKAIPKDKLPALPDGYVDSPELLTKKPTFEFTPDRSMEAKIKVVQ